MFVKRWDQELKYDETIQILTTLALGHCVEAGNCASEVASAITGSRLIDACNFNIDYRDSLDVNALIHLRQALALFSKLEPLDIGIDKQAAALATFEAADQKCRETNDVFTLHAQGDFCFPQDVESILFMAQRKIARVLGDVPEIKDLRLSFGPGATASVPKKYACARIKLSSMPSCSTNLLPLMPTLYRAIPAYANLHGKTIKSGQPDEAWQIETLLKTGRLSFVAKNAKTFRSVKTEPTMNALLQRGYGLDIAAKLKGVGIDLSDQTKNKTLARLASITGEEATLDLSNASGNIATMLVSHLVPYDWFSALDTCRTPVCTMPDNSERKLAEFSSMGNGFTFPLQSLIFWALVKSACEHHGFSGVVSVYGDDIICPAGAIDVVKRLFDAVGFTLNTEKSFATGPFRESCGGDYFHGVNVRPYYQKCLVSGITLFALHNFYVRNDMPEFANKVLGFISPNLRIYGPDGFGDGHLLGDWAAVPKHRDRGWAGHVFDTFSLKPVWHCHMNAGDRILPVYSIYASEPTTMVSLSFPNHRDRRCRKLVVEEAPLPFNKTKERFFIDTPQIPFRTGMQQVPMLALPGHNGYRRTQIYTLTPP